MMQIRSHGRNRLLSAALLLALLVGSAWKGLPIAHAEPAQDVASGQPAAYLEQLMAEINARRERAGTPPLAMAPMSANEALGQYLADLTPLMVATDRCFHGDGGQVRPGWDYVADRGAPGAARGEVIACPGQDGWWTAERIAQGWWDSGTHRSILFNDSRVNVVACGTHGPQRGGSAYQTIVCVTYQG